MRSGTGPAVAELGVIVEEGFEVSDEDPLQIVVEVEFDRLGVHAGVGVEELGLTKAATILGRTGEIDPTRVMRITNNDRNIVAVLRALRPGAQILTSLPRDIRTGGLRGVEHRITVPPQAFECTVAL